MIRKKGRKVPPLSIAKIRALTTKLRDAFEQLDVPKGGQLDVLYLLDVALPQAIPEFSMLIVEDCELGDDLAQTFPDRLQIKVRNSVYEGAESGNGMDRFTLAHELGHLFMHRNLSSYARSGKTDERLDEHKVYEDSEWQADCFAAELLMPFDEVAKCKNADEVCKKFGVSMKSAEVRFDKVNKEKK
ncbi:ImmA/IrrE family metallo-endopeptidase [Rheinheimera sp.]|uniref:ImmA/IrrE family metallo-endopeptidase n=1 Tax=Rheinheimera sp. TaxID=1869214 RepID=UPI003D2BD4A7